MFPGGVSLSAAREHLYLGQTPSQKCAVSPVPASPIADSIVVAGDYLVTVRRDDEGVKESKVFGAVVERKAISDLVGRSFSRDHQKQIRRMTMAVQSTPNLDHAFLLLEGSFKHAEQSVAWGAGAVPQPGSVIQTAQDVRQVVVDLVLQNECKVLCSKDVDHSARLMVQLAIACGDPVTLASSQEHGIALSAFEKECRRQASIASSHRLPPLLSHVATEQEQVADNRTEFEPLILIREDGAVKKGRSALSVYMGLPAGELQRSLCVVRVAGEEVCALRFSLGARMTAHNILTPCFNCLRYRSSRHWWKPTWSKARVQTGQAGPTKPTSGGWHLCLQKPPKERMAKSFVSFLLKTCECCYGRQNNPSPSSPRPACSRYRAESARKQAASDGVHLLAGERQFITSHLADCIASWVIYTSRQGWHVLVAQNAADVELHLRTLARSWGQVQAEPPLRPPADEWEQVPEDIMGVGVEIEVEAKVEEEWEQLPAALQEWSCERCTLLNKGTALVCGICAAPKS